MVKDYQKIEPEVEKEIQRIEMANELKTVSLSELMKMEFPDTQWIVENLVPA